MAFRKDKLSSRPRNARLMLSVMSLLLRKVFVVLSVSIMLLNAMMKDLLMMHRELLEKDLKLLLRATCRDGRRLIKTEWTPSNLSQRLLDVMLMKS